MRPSAALAPLLLLLAMSGAAAAKVLVTEHTASVAVAGPVAQVEHRLAFDAAPPEATVAVPAGARDVQAFANHTGTLRAAPWAWSGEGRVRVTLFDGASTGAPALVLRYVMPAGPSGLALEALATAPTERLALRATVPEGWEARAEGRALEVRSGVAEAAWGGLGPGEARSLVLAPAAGPSPLVVLAGLTLLALALAMARARTAQGRAPQGEMRLLDHLAELQGRLRLMLAAVVVLVLFLFTFELRPLAGLPLAYPSPSLTDNIAAQTFRLLAQQFIPPGVELVVVSPISAALVQVEVALFLALLVASPLLAYEVGAFLMPALEPRERRVLLRAIPAVTLLFVAGAAFAYVVMVPTMMEVLYGYARGLGARALISVDSLVSFAIIVTLLFGLAFQLPVGMVAVARLGLVSPRAMAEKWRHVVVGLFILAAVVTPDPSVVSQVLVAVPLLGLYLVGLAASRTTTRQP